MTASSARKLAIVSKESVGYVGKDKKSKYWFARITFTDSTGKRRNIRRKAANKPQAVKLLATLRQQVTKHGEASIEIERTTFASLTDAYISAKVKPAEYHDDRKIAGLRSHRSVTIRIKALLAYFGKTKLTAITIGEIERFKARRLATPKKNGASRTIAGVNRELELLGAMLTYARNQGWIDATPMERAAKGLVSKADEKRRERTLSHEEERRLLLACTGRRSHLKPLVIAAIDTGCRLGELLSLTWPDIDLEAGIISIRALNSKTLKARQVPISTRLTIELQSLKTRLSSPGLIFGITGSIQKPWGTACRQAKLVDLRFHDLRHTFSTRLLAAGMPLAEIAKLTGHANINTLFAHYINSTPETISRATRLLNQINQANGEGASLSASALPIGNH